MARPVARTPGATTEAALDRRIAAAWIAAVGLLLILAALGLALGLQPEIAGLFLIRQDLPILAVSTAFLLLLRRLGTPWPGLDGWGRFPKTRHSAVVALAAAVALASGLGVDLIQLGYPLSMDEFMATFDATIFAEGLPAAPVAPEWRPYLSALQPFYVTHHAGGAFWTSSYLPGNAALQAAFDLVGGQPAASAFWAALSVLLVYAVARRLWPETPWAALAAAVILASSQQFLVMASTPYAMAAHLALNLLWLTFFLSRTAAGHVAAAVTSLFATGLHQVVFHPLFAAPFVVQLWLERRFRSALFYTACFAAIGLFWMLYPGLVATWAGSDAASAETSPMALLSTALRLIGSFDPLNALIMAPDLLRFIAWQNPLAVPLALCGAWAAWTHGGPLRALLLGIALTAGAMFVLMPYQTHGWGYRYFHGLLGSLAVLAAFGAMRLTVRLTAAEARLAGTRFAAAAVFSFAVLLPAQAYQARRFVQPYAEAFASITGQDVDVVLVDPTGLFYGIDLVRNDPFLTNKPKIMNLLAFDEAGLRSLCDRYAVTVFSTEDGLRHGIRPAQVGGPELAAKAARLSALLQAGDCRTGASLPRPRARHIPTLPQAGP